MQPAFDGSRIDGQFSAPEMVKENDHSHCQADRVGQLQYCETVGGLTCHQHINLAEQFRQLYVIVKRHNGKSRSEKGRQADQKRLQEIHDFVLVRFLFICDYKIRLAYVIYFQLGVDRMDLLDYLQH